MNRRKPVVGIGIGAASVRAVVLSQGQVSGTAEHSYASPGDLPEALRNVLRDVFAGDVRHRAVVAFAALGPALAHIRKIEIQGDARDFRTLDADLRAHADRYFLEPERSRMIVAAGNHTSGSLWAAAFDAHAADVVCDVCRASYLSVQAIAPAAEVLRLATAEREVTWCDGDLTLDVAYTPDGELASVRRRLCADSDSARAGVAVPPLADLGEHAWHYADAYGAAALAFGSGRLLLTADMLSTGVSRDRMRVRRAAGICSLMLGLATVSPGLAARHAIAASGRELASLDPARRAASRVYQTIAAATGMVSRLDSAAGGRRSMTIALAALTGVIPASVFLSDVRLDATGGTLVAIGPHAAALVEQLARPPFAEPSLVGAVTPQGTDSAAIQRATIRFKWSVRSR